MVVTDDSKMVNQFSLRKSRILFTSFKPQIVTIRDILSKKNFLYTLPIVRSYTFFGFITRDSCAIFIHG